MASTPHICTILLILSAPKCHESKRMQKKIKSQNESIQIYTAERWQLLGKLIFYLHQLDSIPLTSLLFCSQYNKIDKMSNYHNLATPAYKIPRCSFMQLIEWVCPSITTNTEKMLGIQFGHLMLQKQDTVIKFLSTGIAVRVITMLELSMLLEYVTHDFITSTHKNKFIQKFKMKKGCLKMERHCYVITPNFFCLSSNQYQLHTTLHLTAAQSGVCCPNMQNLHYRHELSLLKYIQNEQTVFILAGNLCWL